MFNQKLIGLDLGSYSIKISQIQTTKKKTLIRSFGSVLTPPKCIEAGEILNPERVAEVIKDFLKKNKIKTNSVCVGLSGASVIVKKVSVPKMDKELLEEQIRWEAEQYIPYDIEEVSLDFVTLAGRKSAEIMDVLLVAAQNEMVQRLQNLCDEARLNLSHIDVNGFALANIFTNLQGELQGHTVAILDMGHHMTQFLVIDKGEVLFSRDVTIGGLSFTEEIERQLDVNYEEAQNFKHAASDTMPEPVEIALKAATQNFCEKIAASLKFFENSVEDENKIKEIYITGGASSLHGLSDQLTEFLGLKVNVLKLNSDIEIHPSVIVNPGDLNAIGLVSMGLGMRKAGDR